MVFGDRVSMGQQQLLQGKGGEEQVIRGLDGEQHRGHLYTRHVLQSNGSIVGIIHFCL